MKKWIVRIVLLLVVLLIAAVVALFLNLNTIVKKGVETVGPQLTKVTVTLGSADISPLSGSGKLKELFVGNPDGYKTPSAVKVGAVKVSAEIGSVMSDVIVVNEIKVQDPEITFEGSFGGNNLSKILDNVKSSSGSDKSSEKAAPAPSGGEKKFIVKDVTVEGAKIHVSLTSLGGRELTLPLPTLHLQNIGTAGHAVTAKELLTQIIEPLLSSIVKTVTDGVANVGKEALNLGKGAGKEAAGQLNKATDGLKGLFKK